MGMHEYIEARITPKILEYTMQLPTVTLYRKATVARVRGHILEVGFGSGLNLQYYPNHVQEITIIDNNAGHLPIANQRIVASKIKINCKILSAEQLPFEDNTFDTVLSTYTMCSIEDLESALQEFYRVLKPGGKFIFVEHGLSKKSTYVRFWQRLLEPTNRFIGGNCHLTRDFGLLLKKTEFVLEEYEEFEAKKLPRTHAYAYRGVAVKPV
jgi:ubiquinone/menaquinone biosynthesis C-methylase UbiE